MPSDVNFNEDGGTVTLQMIENNMVIEDTHTKKIKRKKRKNELQVLQAEQWRICSSLQISTCLSIIY